MADVLVIRDQITEALYRSLRGGEHGLKAVPGLIRRAIEQEVWTERKVHQMRNKIAKFSSFHEYIKAPPPEGLGATLDLCERMIGDDEQTLVLFRRVTTGKHGGDRRGKDAIKRDNVTLDPKRGNARAYTLERLERERPDLFKLVTGGKMTANAAAIKAGFRRKP